MITIFRDIDEKKDIFSNNFSKFFSANNNNPGSGNNPGPGNNPGNNQGPSNNQSGNN